MARLPTNRPPTHPGDMLLNEFIKPLGITQSEFRLPSGRAWASAAGSSHQGGTAPRQSAHSGGVKHWAVFQVFGAVACPSRPATSRGCKATI